MNYIVQSYEWSKGKRGWVDVAAFRSVMDAGAFVEKAFKGAKLRTLDDRGEVVKCCSNFEDEPVDAATGHYARSI